nr:hypothetical protein [Dialister invisus]
MEKTGSSNMTQSEESITRVTSCRFPHYGGRSFFGTLNDDQRFLSL